MEPASKDRLICIAFGISSDLHIIIKEATGATCTSCRDRNPTAFVSNTGFQLDPFPIERSTRQGCLLSPLLFALAIEPRALLIHLNPNIHGLELNGHQHKLCLFADDTLIFMTSSLISAPNLLDTLSNFKHISGLKVNPNKSTVLNISLPCTLQTQLEGILPLPWANRHVPFLVIKLTTNPIDFYAANYPPMPSHLTLLISKCASLPLTWMGRIAAVKMSILPKVLYLFSSTPDPSAFPLFTHPATPDVLIYLGQDEASFTQTHAIHT